MDKYEYTFPVAGFEPNHHGLCDMDGNVLQWCEEQLPEDQCLAEAARAGMYVLRGSSSQHFDPGDFLSSRRKTDVATVVAMTVASGVCWWAGGAL